MQSVRSVLGVQVHKLFWGIVCLTLLGFWGLRLTAEDSAPAVPKIPGIENLRQVSSKILCGGQPESAESFAGLARRGVQVVISVDGAPTNIEEAHKHGLRYVHVPIGYGKLTAQQRADLVEAVKTANGLVYMHCHHGKHRGPVAAGYCGMAAGDITQEQGLKLLQEAGTRSDYTGLWDAIRRFEAPTVPAGKLVEQADVEPIVAAMVRIENHWTGLEKTLQAGQLGNEETTQELLLLTEEFRELPRVANTSDADLKQQMQTAVTAAEALLQAVKSKANEADNRSAAQRMLQSCGNCHANHRQ